MNDLSALILPQLSAGQPLESMPGIYRLTSIQHNDLSNHRHEHDAYLFHEKASIRVRWVSDHIDTRLKHGVLVAVRWKNNSTCDHGAINVHRISLVEHPVPWLNLFHTIPPGWVKDRELITHAATLIETLPKTHQMLFNAIFWSGDRMRRYCTGPSSMHGHHASRNGNLRHAVDVAQGIQHTCHERDFGNTAIGILAGLLHDAGKADEYMLKENGDWGMTTRGKLLGHKITIIEWIAVARAMSNPRMDENHYQALLHCLSSSASAPKWLGIRKPAMIEATLLNSHDRISGLENLMLHQSKPGSGWGRYHKHLGGEPFVVR